MNISSINSLQQLDQVCQKCCFQQNYQQKTKAQEMVFSFVKNLITQSQGIQSILLGEPSENTIFVVIAYLTKQLKILTNQQILHIVDCLLQSLEMWFQPHSGEFIRNGSILQTHTKNYLFTLLGQSIKCLMKSEDPKRSNLFSKFSFKNSLQLIFWKQLTQIVGSIDMTIGFLSYRNLVYFYQDSGISLAIEIVNKYFKPLTQVVKINELSVLQENLSVQQNQPKRSEGRLLVFTTQQIFLAKGVVELIQQILQFPYNISYGQYDMDAGSQNSVIYFPDLVSKQIIQGDFYQSLFFLTQRFLIEAPTDNMLMVCIDSLKKIILTRVTFCQKLQRKKFTKDSLKGITRLMKLTKNIDNLTIQIIQFNIKMLGNIHLRKLRKLPEFVEWLSLLQQHIRNCILSKPLKFHDPEYNDCFQLIQKLATGFKHDKVIEYRSGFSILTEKLYSDLMLKLFNQTEPLTSQMVITRIKQIKTAATEFFGNIKQLVLWNYEKNITLLLNIQVEIFQKLGNNEFVNVNHLINLNMLVSQLTHISMIHQGYPYEQFSAISIYNIKKIIQNQISYIGKHYQTFGSLYNNSLLNMSTLIYVEVILSDLCGNITANSDNSIHQDGYFLINQSKILKGLELPFSNPETMIVELIGYLMRHLQSEDYKEITHTLEILNTCIMKLKWSIKRTFFKKMPIIKNILTFCLQTSLNNFKTNQLLKCRSQIMKLITVLAFDDCLDSFKDRLDQVFTNLDTSNILTVIYDIKGMAQQIDTSSIFRYFLQKSTPFLISILQSVCTNHLENQKILKQSIKLNQKFLHNYLQRISSAGKSAAFIYQLVIRCIPYWQLIINFLQIQIPNDPEKYGSPATHLIECFNKIIDGRYLNFSILQQHCPQLKTYIMSYMKFVNGLFKTQIYQYPKSKKSLLTTSKYIFESLSQYIYSIVDDNTTLSQYCKLYALCLQVMYQQLNQIVANNQKSSQFNSIVDFMNDALTYQYDALLQTHNIHHFNQARFFKQNMLLKLIQIFFMMLNISILPSIKRTNMDKLTKFLGSIIRIYPQNAKEIVDKVRLCFPTSNIKLFMQFCDICISSDKCYWYQTMNKWKQSVRFTQQDSIIQTI